tara:strand:- start:9920 stop:10684 length:765 start_codon:yes stop_codon:yes gene_type:complete
MAWIQVDQSLIRHRKILALGRSLSVTRTSAVGHMVSFWCWALDNAPGGLLASESDEAIATGADWDGEPEAFVEAVVEAGFIDREGGALHIHDWHDYAGKLVAKRRLDADRQRRRRSQDVTRTSRGRVEKSRVEKSIPPVGPPAGEQWQCPEWFRPIQQLPRYEIKNYSGTVERAEERCREAKVDINRVVADFCAFYETEWEKRKYKDPAAVFSRSLTTQIEMTLNRSSPQPRSSVIPLSGVEAMKEEARRMGQL